MGKRNKLKHHGFAGLGFDIDQYHAAHNINKNAGNGKQIQSQKNDVKYGLLHRFCL